MEFWEEGYSTFKESEIECPHRSICSKKREPKFSDIGSRYSSSDSSSDFLSDSGSEDGTDFEREFKPFKIVRKKSTAKNTFRISSGAKNTGRMKKKSLIKSIFDEEGFMENLQKEAQFNYSTVDLEHNCQRAEKGRELRSLQNTESKNENICSSNETKVNSKSCELTKSLLAKESFSSTETKATRVSFTIKTNTSQFSHKRSKRKVVVSKKNGSKTFYTPDTPKFAKLSIEQSPGVKNPTKSKFATNPSKRKNHSKFAFLSKVVPKQVPVRSSNTHSSFRIKQSFSQLASKLI